MSENNSIKKQEINDKFYRKSLGMFSTGITVVTTLDEENNPIGMTVNSFASVSLDPPLVLWSIDKKQPSYKTFLNSKGYAVNILSKKQLELCNHFSSPLENKFQSLEWKLSSNGFPLLSNSLAWFDCTTWERYSGGDHKILVAKVNSYDFIEADPLTYWNGIIS